MLVLTQRLPGCTTITRLHPPVSHKLREAGLPTRQPACFSLSPLNTAVGNQRLEKPGRGGIFNCKISTFSGFASNSNICAYTDNLKTPETVMIRK